MNKILKDLYSGSLFPAEKCGTDNKEIKELTRHLNIIFDKLKNCLSGNAELLDLFEKTSICLNALYQEEFFVAGFKLGVKIATEALYN